MRSEITYVWALRGASGPRESGKSLEKVFRDLFETFFQTLQTFSRLLPDSGGVPGLRLFSDFFGVSGPEARETPVNGQQVPKGREAFFSDLGLTRASKGFLESPVSHLSAMLSLGGFRALIFMERHKGPQCYHFKPACLDCQGRVSRHQNVEA